MLYGQGGSLVKSTEHWINKCVCKIIRVDNLPIALQASYKSACSKNCETNAYLKLFWGLYLFCPKYIGWAHSVWLHLLLILTQTSSSQIFRLASTLYHPHIHFHWFSLAKEEEINQCSIYNFDWIERIVSLLRYLLCSVDCVHGI